MLPHSILRRIQVKLILTAGLMLTAAATSWAQSVTPVVAEYQAKADVNAISNGQVVLRNDSIYPMTASVEALSFDLSDSDHPQELKPLTSNIDVQFENTSARIPAKQEYTLYYKATCAKAPCWFMIMSTFVGPKPKTTSIDDGGAGVMLAVRLPTAVYVYGHTPVQPKDIKLSWSENTLLFQNTSTQCARVKSIEAHMKNGQVMKSGAFPVLPRGVRGSDRLIKFEEKPEYVVVHFQKFSIDSRNL
jgi:hypothetical protein